MRQVLEQPLYFLREDNSHLKSLVHTLICCIPCRINVIMRILYEPPWRRAGTKESYEKQWTKYSIELVNFNIWKQTNNNRLFDCSVRRYIDLFLVIALKRSDAFGCQYGPSLFKNNWRRRKEYMLTQRIYPCLRNIYIYIYSLQKVSPLTEYMST